MSDKKPKNSIVRSSAAEYLTFVAATGESGVEVVYADENIWLSQKMMSVLYGVDVRTVNFHLKTIFSTSELVESSEGNLPDATSFIHSFTPPEISPRSFL